MGYRSFFMFWLGGVSASPFVAVVATFVIGKIDVYPVLNAAIKINKGDK